MAVALLGSEPFENGYKTHENVLLLDGSKGNELIAQGVILDSQDNPCAAANVTVALVDREDGKWQSVQRCIHHTSDKSGLYQLRGDSSNGFSLFWAEKDGQFGASYTADEIQLRGGETVVHVRDESGNPMVNATVTVHVSGIDDMAFVVPPNLRRLLERKTDKYGTVRYPSRLGDFDLGFEVRLADGRTLTRVFYNGLSQNQHKLFVFTEDHVVAQQLANQLATELHLDPATTEVEFGSPGHFHGY